MTRFMTTKAWKELLSLAVAVVAAMAIWALALAPGWPWVVRAWDAVVQFGRGVVGW